MAPPPQNVHKKNISSKPRQEISQPLQTPAAPEPAITPETSTAPQPPRPQETPTAPQPAIVPDKLDAPQPAENPDTPKKGKRPKPLVVTRPRRVRAKQPGARTYANWSEKSLTDALEAIKSGKLTLRGASKEYQIPLGTLSRRNRNLNPHKFGRPQAVNLDDEKRLVESLCLCSKWGCPLTTFEMRCIVKHYFDAQCKTILQFKNNLPGLDWVRNFLYRHQNVISSRLCDNLKRARAAVDDKIIKDYFAELKQTLDGVSDELIVNYDETNTTDDPGRKLVLARIGSKHVHRILDSSKSSTSVMFAGTASGTLLDPYVCYKAEHLYDTWTQGGWKNWRYNRSKSGWFNAIVFDDWFFHICLPYFKKFPKDANKVLLGDNLSSHLSVKVTEACLEHNIRFTFFPANSTHLCQPLGVGFFSSLKTSWRKSLDEWKSKNRGPVSEQFYPQLLKKAIENIKDTKNNLKSAFKATGIFPFNPDAVLKRVAKTVEETRTVAETELIGEKWRDSFEFFLSESRKSEVPQTMRKKKLTVAPGKSISLADLEDDPEIESTSSGKRGKSSRGRPKKKSRQSEASDESDPDNPDEVDSISLHDSDSVANSSSDSEGGSPEGPSPQVDPKDLKVGNFVLVSLVYDKGTKKEQSKNFIAKILKVCPPGQVFLDFKRKPAKTANIYTFPTVKDEGYAQTDQIKQILRPLFIQTGRHCFPVEIET